MRGRDIGSIGLSKTVGRSVELHLLDHSPPRSIQGENDSNGLH